MKRRNIVRAGPLCLKPDGLSLKRRQGAELLDESPPLFAAIPQVNACEELARAAQGISEHKAERSSLAPLYEHENCEPCVLIKSVYSGNPNPSNTNNANTTASMFGNPTNTAQQPSTNSIFGNRSMTQPAPGASNMLGGTTMQQQPAASNTLGSNTAQQPATASLFGGTGAPQQLQPSATSSLFGGSSAPGGSSFPAAVNANLNNVKQFSHWGSSTQAGQQANSLLNATLRAQQTRLSPFGRLSMGQNATGNAAAVTDGPASAARYDFTNLRSTTRFEDCIDPLREALEGVDRLVQNQESWARQIEAVVARHDLDVASLAPDVDLVRDAADATEHSLASDASDVSSQRSIAKSDHADILRAERVLTNLLLPRHYQFSAVSMYRHFPHGLGRDQRDGGGGPAGQEGNVGAREGMRDGSGGGGGGVRGGGIAGAGRGGDGIASSSSPSSSSSAANPAAASALGGDTDMVGNYFVPLAADMAKVMAGFEANLAEIEAHMRVIEGSALERARGLAAHRRGGAGGLPGGPDETVRELADTLRGFERGILDTAGVVGECREGVNELLLGRLGGGLR